MRLIFKSIYDFLDNYFHRPKLERYLKNLDLKCKTIIDIGSHTGESISFFSKLYPSSKIFGFEPQKNCFIQLKKKFSSKKIKIENYALGEKKNKKILYKNYLSNTSTFSKLNKNSKHFKIKSFILGNTNAGYYSNETVKVIALSYYYKKKKLPKIDIVKIDTEGHEIEVLIGLKSILKNIRVIIIEHNFTDYYVNYDLEKIKNFLKRNSFENQANFKFPFMNYSDSVYINAKFLNKN